MSIKQENGTGDICAANSFKGSLKRKRLVRLLQEEDLWLREGLFVRAEHVLSDH